MLKQRKAIDNAAALNIQLCFRRFKARRAFRERALRFLIKRIDPESGEVFYFDKRSLGRLSRRPAAFRRADSVLPPPDWTMRKDDIGAHFYMNAKTKARRWHRPAGYITCGSCATDVEALNKGCKKDLATLVDVSLGVAFCYECYSLEQEKDVASRVDIHVQAQLCTACSFRKAVFVCFKCATFRCRRCGYGKSSCDHSNEAKL